MNKNKYMAIIIGATAVCMIIGTLYHALGAFRFHRDTDPGREVEIVEEWTDGNKEAKTLQKEDTEAVSGQNEAEPASEKEDEPSAADEKNETLKRVVLNVELADLTIQTGEEVRVDFRGDDDLRPEVTQKDGVLTVTQHVDTKWLNVFKLNNKRGVKITVTIPEGEKLEELTSNLNLGDARLNNINVDKCSVSNDLGDIKCEGCRFSEIRIYSSMGDVDVKNCDFLDMGVQQDLGDVDISTQQDLTDADLNLETDLGDLHVNNEDLGDKFSRRGNGEVRVVVENDMGDIRLDYAA